MHGMDIEGAAHLARLVGRLPRLKLYDKWQASDEDGTSYMHQMENNSRQQSAHKRGVDSARPVPFVAAPVLRGAPVVERLRGRLRSH